MTIVLAPTLHEAERYRFTFAADITPVSSAHDLDEALAADAHEDLVVIAPDIEWSVALDIAKRYRTGRPRLGVVVQRRRADVTTLNQALRAGVREVVDADDAATLVAAAARSRVLSADLVPDIAVSNRRHQRGQLIVVFSPKGGTGKTMLATHLAVALAMADMRTCLVDLDLQFGDVAIALGMEPSRTTSDALGLRDAIDDHALNSLLLQYRTNLSVLPAPTRPAEAEFISPDLVETLLGGLLASYDFVIADSPPSFTDNVLRAMDMADMHMLVSTPDIASLKSLRVALDTLNDLGYPAAKRRIILNRDEPNLGLSHSDIRAIVPSAIDARIPMSRDVIVCLNRGTTVIEESPRHPVSRAIRSLAQRIVAEQPTQVPASVA